MSPSLGRRYERLLFFAGPLTLVTAVVFFVALAAGTDATRNLIRCYSDAGQILQTNRAVLDSSWARRPAKQGLDQDLWQIRYINDLQRSFILGTDGCADKVPELLREPAVSPSQLLTRVQDRERELSSTPLQFIGIEVPEKASINVFGTVVKVPLPRFAQVLVFTLAPLLMLWFASLYNTRYRETNMISKAAKVTDVFPHILNVYPTPIRRTQEPRRRVRGLVVSWFLLMLAFALTRVCLFLLLTGPAAAGFFGSVVMLYPPTRVILDLDMIGVVVYALSIGVLATFLSNVWLEFMPWHFWKIYAPIRDVRYM